MYNSQDHIEECILSCIQQGDVVKEIIVVDDHSTDKSAEKVLNFVDQHPNLISYYMNENKGACAARNYGYRISTGMFIQFLDADDKLGENKISEQAKLLENNEDALSSCGWIKFKSIAKDGQYHQQKIDQSYEDPIQWLVDSWNDGGMGQTGIWLIPRILIEKAGVWNEDLLKNQDGEFVSRLIISSKKIIFCQTVFTYYREPGINNISTNVTLKSIESLLNSYKLYEKVLHYRNDQEVKQALCKNYSEFIYQYYNKFEGLGKKAIAYIQNLGGRVEINFSNTMVNLVSKWIGFKPALMLRKLVLGY